MCKVMISVARSTIFILQLLALIIFYQIDTLKVALLMSLLEVCHRQDFLNFYLFWREKNVILTFVQCCNTDRPG